MTTPVSRHLTLEQLVHTSRPIANGLQQTLRYGHIHSAEQIRKDLERTARDLMDPLIDKFGPGVISSGYRCPALNRAVGGSTNSAHLVGLAVDWQPSVTIREAMEWAGSQHLPFDRLIVEERGATRWLHVQEPPAGAAPLRLFFESPRGGIYTALTPEKLAALQV